MSMMPRPSPSLGGASGQAVGNTAAGLQPNKIPKGYQLGGLQRFSPQQNELFSSLFSHLGPQSYLQQLALGSDEAFAPQEEMAWRDYQSGIGNLASRFSGLGSGSRRSSGFQNFATQSAEDFATKLRAQRQQLQSEALNELFGLSNMLLSQQPYENFLTMKPQKQPGFLKQLALGLTGSLGQAGSQLGSLYGASKLGIF